MSAWYRFPATLLSAYLLFFLTQMDSSAQEPQFTGGQSRSWIGLDIQPVTPEIVDAARLKSNTGAVVVAVTPDSPAADAGINVGDVLVSFNGKAIADRADLAVSVAEMAPGSRTTIGLVRQRDLKTLLITIGTRPEGEVAPKQNTTADRAHNDTPAMAKDRNGDQAGIIQSGNSDGAGARSNGWIGLQIEPVARQLAGQLGLKTVAGAYVVKSVPDGPAANAGISSGDIITSLDGSPIADPRDLALRISGMAPGSSIRVGLLRDGQDKELPVTLGMAPVGNNNNRGPDLPPEDATIAAVANMVGISLDHGWYPTDADFISSTIATLRFRSPAAASSRFSPDAADKNGAFHITDVIVRQRPDAPCTYDVASTHVISYSRNASEPPACPLEGGCGSANSREAPWLRIQDNTAQWITMGGLIETIAFDRLRDETYMRGTQFSRDPMVVINGIDDAICSFRYGSRRCARGWGIQAPPADLRSALRSLHFIFANACKPARIAPY